MPDEKPRRGDEIITWGSQRDAPPGGKALSGLVVVLAAALMCKGIAAGPIPSNPRYLFQPVGDDEGLATRGATCLYQDAVGFIWIGSQDGLFRYDGAQVERFTGDDGAPWAAITQITGDPSGMVWVVAEADIARFNGVRFETVEIELQRNGKGGLTLDVPQPLSFAGDGSMFLATGQGIARVDPSTGKTISMWTSTDGLPDAVVRSVNVAPDGIVWFAAGGMVGWLDPGTGKVELYDIFEDNFSEDIVAVLVSEEGTVWVRTRNNLLKMEAGESCFTPTCPGVAEAASDGMPSLDREGRLMVPSRGGLYYETENGWEVLSARNGLRVNSVWSALEDREGGIWFGLGGAGVSRSPGRGSWYAWTSAEGLPDDGIWGMVRDPAGRLWVGTNRGVGIWLPDENRWKTIRKEDGIIGDSVWKLVLDGRGSIWILSRRLGITRVDLETFEPHIVVLPEVYSSGPTDLALGPDGNLWVSGNDYLFRIIEEADEEISFEDVDYPDTMEGCTEVMAVSPDGVVWTGGRNGLGRLDRDRWTRFTMDDGLVNNRVEYLSAESGTVVWMDCRAPVGVTRFELEGAIPSIRQIDTRDGLVGDTVFLLEHDLQGRVWVGTADGISLIDRNWKIRNFDTGDGLIWNDISQGGLWSEPDGGIFIGTGRGLAYYRPHEESAPDPSPTIVITSASLGGEEELLTSNLKVPYGNAIFVARYSGLVFNDSVRLTFRYRLLGLEKEYFETQQREVRYPALPSGSYTFEVMCRASDGSWSDSPAMFSFVIEPPWWESWWSRLGAAALVVLVVFLILEFRTRKLARDRRRLEAAVAQRSRELAEANRELREMSFTDVLTRARNRRFFSSVVDADVFNTLRKNDARNLGGQERNRDLVFYMVDIDFFKRVNDVFGHMVGDRVLVETARRLGMSIRQSDLLVRWGGEEFLIVCRDAEREEGHMVTRRVLDMIGEVPFDIEGAGSFRRTCSVGWASFPAYRSEPSAVPYEMVLELADRALYLAKESGRNCGVGVEIMEEAFEEGGSMDWLSAPLTQIDGKHIRLIRVEGSAPTPDPDPSLD